jgi:formylglycine-generating enzyme required for sulfatase activity
MEAILSRCTLDRAALRARYLANRIRSSSLFSIARPAAYESRPIPLRLPIAFYEGHLPAFSFNTLIRRGLGEASVNAGFEELFERGIDPATLAEADCRRDRAWPAQNEIRAFGAVVDARVLQALDRAPIDDASRSPLLERAQAAFALVEHEEMHHETLLYILHQLPYACKHTGGRSGAYVEREPLARGRATVGAGTATLGAERDALPFGWDNEFEERRVEVAAFEIDVNDVTNGDWLEFAWAGGPLPPFWIEREGEFRLLGMFEELPLPRTWPVYVTQAQAGAYAAWKGARLPTEPEYHRAAFGTPHGDERSFPWGNEAPDARKHGNFDFRRFEPEPVGINPGGASAWGVHDLVGNGWEWTSTPFAPLEGFAPMASFPGYSADFFDGGHFVMKGASPATNRNHVRRSFRNWFRADYPYVYATFRCVHD